MKSVGKNILVNSLFLLAAASFSPLHSFPVRSVVVAGGTVNIDLTSVTGIRDVEISREKIRMLGARIVNTYHDYGYSMAGIQSIIVRKNGVLEFHIDEGIISGIALSGITGTSAKEVYAFFQPEIGKPYNDNRIRGRTKDVRNRVALKGISVKPVREEGGGIRLDIHGEGKKGHFRGNVGFDMIYGVSPFLAYLYPGRETAIDFRAVAGVKEGEIRRLEGSVRASFSGEPGRGGLMLGVGGGKRVERWESIDTEYSRERVSSQLGVTFSRWVLFSRFFASFAYEKLEDYPDAKELVNPALNIEVTASDYGRVLDKRRAFYMGIILSAGRENITGSYTYGGSFNCSVPFLPAENIRVIPRFLISFISSDERILWSYVFDNSMVGIFGDYTASRWKNIAGLETEYRFSPSLLKTGIFINSAYYLDEAGSWKLKTGTGISGTIKRGVLRFKIIYGWDIDEGARDGGVLFFLESEF